MKIGGRIKNLAALVRYIGIGASALVGIGCIGSWMMSGFDSDAIGVASLAIAIGGALSSYIVALLLDGFGELVGNSSIIAELMLKTDAQGSEDEYEE